MPSPVRTLLPYLTLLALAPLACDPVVCSDTDSGDPVVDSYTPPTGGPEEPPPQKTCGPITTDPKVACGLVCVDEYGVSVVVLCALSGSWECKYYPRSRPVVGEVYEDLPVWCGG